MKKKWYYNTWLIAILFSLWWLYLVPLVIGIVLLVKKNKAEQQWVQDFKSNNSEIERLKLENQRLNDSLLAKSKEQETFVETLNCNTNSKNDDIEQLKMINNDLSKDLENLKQRHAAFLKDINSKYQQIEQINSEKNKILNDLEIKKQYEQSLLKTIN